MYKTENVRKYDSGKVAKLSGFGVNLKKTQGGGGIHPPGLNRVKPPGNLVSGGLNNR